MSLKLFNFVENIQIMKKILNSDYWIRCRYYIPLLGLWYCFRDMDQGLDDQGIRVFSPNEIIGHEYIERAVRVHQFYALVLLAYLVCLYW